MIIHPYLPRLSLLLSTIYKALVLPLMNNLQLRLRVNVIKSPKDKITLKYLVNVKVSING